MFPTLVGIGKLPSQGLELFGSVHDERWQLLNKVCFLGVGEFARGDSSSIERTGIGYADAPQCGSLWQLRIDQESSHSARAHSDILAVRRGTPRKRCPLGWPWFRAIAPE